jgi:hypothetical protein
MLASLWLPIVLSGVALFFASFLSWMVLQLHKKDWQKLRKEDEFIAAVRQCEIQEGSYMFPMAESPAEMKNEEFKRKFEAGPRGIVTVFGGMNMGMNLVLTMIYFFVISFMLAYLSTIALKRGAPFLDVFRFVTTAGLMTFLSAIVQHAIWFRTRIVGHVIESIAYAIIVGVIFAAMWPK